MKKGHIVFPSRGLHGRAPRIQSRSMGLRHLVNVAYKSDGGDDDEEKEKKALLLAVAKQVKDELNTRAFQSKDDVDKLITEKMKDLSGLNLDALRSIDGKPSKVEALETALREQGTIITDLQKRGAEGQPMTVRAIVEKWHTDNKDALEKIKNGQRADLTPMEIRSPITMTVATSTGSSSYVPNVQVLPGVTDLVRNQPVFAQYFSRGRRASSPTIVWVNKTNKQGNATFIGEGTIKALASFELSTETSSAKKVAERMKVSTEMLYDIDYMASLIEGELKYEVDMAVDSEVFNGVGTGVHLKGFTAYGTAYTLTTVSTTTPNNSDAIMAGATQLRSLNFNPDLAFMNTIDVANMQMKKSTTGEYVLPPFQTADGMRVGSVRVIETNNVPVGYVAVVDSSKYNLYDYMPYTVAWGWENDDFSKNLVTVIGERRLHSFMSANLAGAILYDTLANIKTGITAA